MSRGSAAPPKGSAGRNPSRRKTTQHPMGRHSAAAAGGREHKKEPGAAPEKGGLWPPTAPGDPSRRARSPEGDGQGGTRRGHALQKAQARTAARAGPKADGPSERHGARKGAQRPSGRAGGNGRGPGPPKGANAGAGPRSGGESGPPERHRGGDGAPPQVVARSGEKARRKSGGTNARRASRGNNWGLGPWPNRDGGRGRTPGGGPLMAQRAAPEGAERPGTPARGNAPPAMRPQAVARRRSCRRAAQRHSEPASAAEPLRSGERSECA